MEINSKLDKIYEMQVSWYTWRKNANTFVMIGLSFLVACFTVLMGQVSIPIPWSPVLITFQTFAVLLAGSFLGGKWGGFSMILHAILCIIGIPWFINSEPELAVIFPSMWGYLIGFIFAAAFIGYIFDHYTNSRKPVQTIILMLFTNFVIIYIPGLIGLYYFMLCNGKVLTLSQLLLAGFIPFIIGDLIKIALASSISTSILPKKE